jgi:hypothetical protein
VAASDTVTVKFKILEDGSLQQVGQQADKAAAGLDKAGNSADRFSKRNKGVAQTGLSSAKSFSKMSSGIQGGLVPAYATLAAHVFAVTAAFGVLSRSQAVKQLNEGLLFTGRAAGDNLTIVTRNLREITDNAISSADAMKALAVGVSAGFSESQMEGLTRVAKGASLALGRDMTDALDRLVRGAAKLEPEILDELGIMVRLDDATEKYAAKLGIAVTELTQFERRMAFTNAIIEQGETKFAALSMAVDSNPFNQLAATFDDMVKGFMNGINMIAGPIAGFLSGSMPALIASMGILGTGVLKMMVPALAEAGTAQADLSKRMHEGAKANLANTKAYNGAPKVFSKLQKSIQNGTATQKEFDQAQKSVTASVKLHEKQLVNTTKEMGYSDKAIDAKKLKIKEGKIALVQMTAAQELETLSTKKAAEADILAAGAAGSFGTTLKLLKLHIQTESAATLLATAGKGFLARAYAQVTMWAGFATLSVKAFGLALLTSIPIIGQVIMVAMLLWEGLKWLFGSEAEEVVNPLADVLEEGKERLEEYPNIIAQMADAYAAAKTDLDRYVTSLTAMNGIMGQTVTHLQSLRIHEEAGRQAKVDSAQRALDAAKAAEKEAAAGLAAGGVSVVTGVEMSTWERTKAYFKMLNSQDPNTKLGSAGSGSALSGVYNDAIAERIRLETELAILPKPGDPASEDRNASAIAAIKGQIMALDNMQKTVKKGSEEWVMFGSYSAEASAILGNLATVGLAKTEEALLDLSIRTEKTVQSFKSLKEIAAEVDALFAGRAAVTGTFNKELKLMDKGIAALARTDNTKAQTEALEAAFKKFGAANGEELVALRAKYAEVNSFRKAEGILDGIAANRQASLNKAGKVQEALLSKQFDLSVKKFFLQQEQELARKAGEDGIKEEIALLKLANEQEKVRLALIKERVDTHKRVGGDTLGGMMSVVGSGEENQKEYDSASGSDKIRMLGESLTPMMEQLEKLGPEGLLVSAVVEGSFLMGEAFTAFSEKLTAGTATTSDGLALAAAGMATLGNIASAASNAKIAGIDAEIEAEKKRDGKSAQSVAKMAALEKKKEAAKRKAFEQNKKIQMASVILSTAAAAMAAWAPPPVGAGPLFGGALTAGIVALGAAQLAIISGTSYAGGGSIGGGGAGPSKISIGERSNTVDLGRGNNAGGELGYMRGESGTGTGATNFKPTGAFAGYKGRASGGYIVGEQGPEVFMPDSAGSIIPSGQGAGGSTNVSFNIQAIDASGVEDVLIAQKGQIIRMIREAANEHGEFFLENVREEAYQK